MTGPRMSAMPPANAAARVRPDRHESFLVCRRFFYLKLALATAAAAILIYLVDRPYGPRYGGSWAGYTLGIAGALLILWLMSFGYWKRSYTTSQGKLVEWLSAHVYLGILLLLVATLHTGFSFGWNIHTLAYGLMCVVIASGVFGVVCYSRYPALMTRNRGGATMPQMLARLAALNDELRTAALSLDDRSAALVERATETTEIGGGFWQQLSGRAPSCATAAALADIEAAAATRQVRLLLDEKAQLLARARRDISYKATMDIWLYLHVPLSFALLAALIAHIVSVFFLG
jgi:hypothetical protein